MYEFVTFVDEVGLLYKADNNYATKVNDNIQWKVHRIGVERCLEEVFCLLLMRRNLS